MCRRLRCERDRLKLELRRWHEMDRRDKHKYYNDDLSRRLRLLEESNDKLKREAAAAKDEEDTLLNEMEATGQAFEDMQEQNTRLLAQLKEKDDANFKLMTEVRSYLTVTSIILIL
jgi:E3 ubiquitin-protein ligase BRE1